MLPRPDEIAHIDVTTYGFAAVMCNPDPPNHFVSEYSLPHAAATMEVRGHAGHAALDDAAVPWRHGFGRHASWRLTDGRTATHACDSHRGDFQQPFAEAELRD